jgi:hypothetical protein
MATPALPQELAKQAVDAVNASPTKLAAAAALNLSRGALEGRLRAAARLYGLHPTPRSVPAHGFEVASEHLFLDADGAVKRRTVHTRPAREIDYAAPEGHVVKGESVLVDSENRVVQRWVKTSAEAEDAARRMKAVAEALKEKLPRAAPVKAPRPVNTDLLNQFTITDVHFGMLSWREETGADYDLGIAEKLLTDWFSAAIELAPQAHTAVLAQLGDLLHHDGHESVTPTHGHVLDADSRLQKVIRVVIRTVRRVVAALLARHQHVHIIMADANHDPASGAWLREMFSAFYEDEPRVTVDSTASTYYCYEWGDTSLFYHHGHRRKPADVDSVFAGRWREIYGRTRFSYAHLGHRHADELRSTPLMKVEQHETLAAPDAYAANGGWLSGRSAKVITYSKTRGEIFRSILSAEMVANMAEASK